MHFAILIRLEYIPFYFISFHKEFITCKIINTNIPIQRATFAWGLQKHSPYLPVFNYHMKLMYEQGTIKKLYQKYKPPPQFCPDKGGRPINFDSCLTAFLSLSGKFTLFRKKSFELNLLLRQNASIFAIFIEKENPCSFFHFSFRATLLFT